MSIHHIRDEVNIKGIAGVPARLRQLRGRTSQEQFANLTGVNQSTYSYYERGVREISLTTASRIAEALSVDLAWLLIGVPSDSVLRALKVPASMHEPQLAEMLAWLAREWEAHNEHGRARLKRRFEEAFPEWEKESQG